MTRRHTRRGAPESATKAAIVAHRPTGALFPLRAAREPRRGEVPRCATPHGSHGRTAQAGGRAGEAKHTRWRKSTSRCRRRAAGLWSATALRPPNTRRPDGYMLHARDTVTDTFVDSTHGDGSICSARRSAGGSASAERCVGSATDRWEAPPRVGLRHHPRHRSRHRPGQGDASAVV